MTRSSTFLTLYHWRIAPGSTAGSGSEKPYALLAAIRALQEHLKRIGAEATVEQVFDEPAILHVRYAVPQPAPKVSLIIPTRDGVDFFASASKAFYCEPFTRTTKSSWWTMAASKKKR